MKFPARLTAAAFAMSLLPGLLPPDARAAAGGAYDLSNGIALPDASYSVFENPAAMPLARGAVFHAGAVAGSHTDSGLPPLLLTYVGGGDTAFGFGAHQYAETVRLTGGLGHSFGGLALGLSASTRLPASGGLTLGIDLGLRQELSGDSVLAIVLEDVTGSLLDRWMMGFGFRLSSTFVGELDFLFSSGGEALGFDQVVARGAISANASNISFLLGYGVQVVPDLAGAGDIRLGVNYWASRDFGLYGMYNSFYGGHVVGIKIRM